MDKQTYDTLYNKTIKDITKEDLALYNRLISLSSYNKEVPFIAAIAIPLMFLWGNLILPGNIGIVSVITLGAGIPLYSAFHLSNVVSARSVLKDMGISPKEFKEFKKSGGLKRIKKIVKEYKKNPYNASNIYQLPNGLKIEDFEKQEQATKTQTKEQKKAKILSQQKLSSSNGLNKTDENQEDWTIQH